MPAGAPTKYKPEFCQMLIDHMTQGLSYESFAAITETHKDSLYEWEKVHPEFSEAKKKGLALSQMWWEKVYAEHATGGIKTGAATAIFAMKCKFQWREAEPVLPDINLTLKYNLKDDDDE